MSKLSFQELISLGIKFETAKANKDGAGVRNVFKQLYAAFPEQNTAHEALDASLKYIRGDRNERLWYKKTLMEFIPEEQKRQVPRLLPDADALSIGVKTELDKYFASPEELQKAQQIQQAAEADNPNYTKAGAFMGQVLPSLGAEVALAALPLGRVASAVTGLQSNAMKGLGNLAWNDVSRAGMVGLAEGAAHAEKEAVPTALSGMLGATVGKWIGDRFTPPQNLRLPETRELIKKVEDKGYFANPGLKYGTQHEMQLDNALKLQGTFKTTEQLPIKLLQNKQLYNSEFAQAVGLGDDVVQFTPNMLQGRVKDINEELEVIYKLNPPTLNKRDQRRYGEMQGTYIKNIGQNIPKSVKEIMDEMRELHKRSANDPQKTNENIGIQTLNFHDKLINKRDKLLATTSRVKHEEAKIYDKLAKILDAGLYRTMGDKELFSVVKQMRGQQLLLSHMLKDKDIINKEGMLNPLFMSRVFRDINQEANVDKIAQFQDLYESTRFMNLQDKSMQANFALKQKLANYYGGKGGKATFNIGSRLPGVLPVPGIKDLNTSMYLNDVYNRYNLPPIAGQGLKQLGGAAGIGLAPEIESKARSLLEPNLDQWLGP